jgi:rhodanese-related sulfurtransferase
MAKSSRTKHARSASPSASRPSGAGQSKRGTPPPPAPQPAGIPRPLMAAGGLAAVAVIAILVAALVGGGTTTAAPPAPPGSAGVATPGGSQVAALPAEVSVEEAAQLRDDGAFMLDVREQEEWNEVHMPGATLIPLGELAARVAEVPTDREVVVVCRSGNRSATGRDILLAAGHPGVTSMAGGMTDWSMAGLPIETGP